MRSSDEEKTIQVMRLLHPDLEPDDLFNNDSNESLFINDGSDSGDEEKDDISIGILTSASVQRHNHSILRHAYDLVEAVGPKGVMQNDLVEELGLAKLDARCVLRVLLRLQMVDRITKDIDKSRVFV